MEQVRACLTFFPLHELVFRQKQYCLSKLKCKFGFYRGFSDRPMVRQEQELENHTAVRVYFTVVLQRADQAWQDLPRKVSSAE